MALRRVMMGRINDAQPFGMPAVQARFSDIGLVVVPKARRTTEFLTDFVPKELARWAGPIAASGATVD